MNEITLTEHKYQSLTLWAVYCLYLFTLPAIIGIAINWMEIRKTEQIKGNPGSVADPATEILDSHHRWLMRTFIFCMVFSLAAIGTSYYGVGYFLAVLTVVWWFYRVIKGMVMLSANKPMPD
ncbi:MAG: hypothetical protein LJE85_14260 [Gammaproteobacteria bacterium]|jgi:uncharacterized membrane protein|nr:hypothetical protein [Gammaproteobacteria bacterium]